MKVMSAALYGTRTHTHTHTHTQTLVHQYDSQEHDLFSQARSAETQRKKQTQVVVEIDKELETLKQANARRLKVHSTQTCTLYSVHTVILLNCLMQPTVTNIVLPNSPAKNLSVSRANTLLTIPYSL